MEKRVVFPDGRDGPKSSFPRTLLVYYAFKNRNVFITQYHVH